MIRRCLVGLLLSGLPLGPVTAWAALTVEVSVTDVVPAATQPAPAAPASLPAPDAAAAAAPVAETAPEPAAEPPPPPPPDPVAEAARRSALAERIVQQPSSQLAARELGNYLADMAARPMFKSLRRDLNWGPDHPVWQRQFPEFVIAYASLSEELSPDVPGRLKEALAASMSEAELGEVATTLGSPRFRELERKLRSLGLDQRTALTLVGMSTSPELFSRSEKEAMRRQVLTIGNREQELLSLNQWMESAMREFRTPAFQRYEKILPEVLTAARQRIKNDEHAMEALKNFVTAWRLRVAAE